MPNPNDAATTRDVVLKLRHTRDQLAALKVDMIADTLAPSITPEVGEMIDNYIKAIDASYLELVEVAYHVIMGAP